MSIEYFQVNRKSKMLRQIWLNISTPLWNQDRFITNVKKILIPLWAPQFLFFSFLTTVPIPNAKLWATIALLSPLRSRLEKVRKFLLAMVKIRRKNFQNYMAFYKPYKLQFLWTKITGKDLHNNITTCSESKSKQFKQ